MNSLFSVSSENETEEQRKDSSSNASADSIQSSQQTADSAHHQEAREVTADGERGLLSDTKSNEDSGNYSGSDESWESSPEAQESSPEGQESSSGVEEVQVETKFSSENQESQSETKESNLEKNDDSQVQENSAEKEKSEKSPQRESEECSEENSKNPSQEASSTSQESTSETQQPNNAQEEKPASDEQTTCDEHEDDKCKSESGKVKEGANNEEDETAHSKEDQQSQPKEPRDEPAQPQSQVIPQQQVFDVVDNDDYLLYLEDILKKIHKVFFKEYEASLEEQEDQKLTKMQPGGQKGVGVNERPLPDLKKIVPAVKREVLQGVNIVFSGVVPQQVKLKDSKAYLIGTSFGATVSEKLVVRGEAGPPTTHLVAANRHTEKVNAARKVKSIRVSTTFISQFLSFILEAYQLNTENLSVSFWHVFRGYKRCVFSYFFYS